MVDTTYCTSPSRKLARLAPFVVRVEARAIRLEPPHGRPETSLEAELEQFKVKQETKHHHIMNKTFKLV